MPADALSGTERAIVEAVLREQLMNYTRGIAQWVRLSGTEDERKAFEYVAEQLRQLGVESHLYLGFGYISLPRGAALRVGQKELRAITHSMAASTPDGGVDLPAIYLGNGAESDLAAQDVRGRAVVIEGLAMPARVLAANHAGAAACIFVNHDRYVHEMIVSGVWGSPTSEDKHQLPQIPVVSLGKEDGDILRALVTGPQPVEVHLEAQVETRWREIPTLTAQVDGVDEPEKFVLFSGHIDSWHYGAMDNGSANATMLEALRVLLPYRNMFRRGLRLAFWSGHSHGRYAGSTWYADNFWEDLHENCVMHINVDSTGGQNAVVLSEAPAMAETQPCASAIIQALTGVEFAGTRFGRAGDQSFQGHGIPSLFMSLSVQPVSGGDSPAEMFSGGAGRARDGGLGWWWHTTEDTVDKIDPDFLVRDTRIYAAIIYRFLSSALLPLNVQASAEDLLHHLRMWQQKAGQRFDLSGVVARAEEVANLAERFQARLAAGAGELPSAALRQLNAIISAVEKPLVRLNYVQADPYAHDPALSQPPVPLLAPLDALLASAPGSDTHYEITTLLVRRRNRILHELAQARHSLQEGLTLLGKK
ncbi:MAG TPA: M28 family peptidase [Ktedonobacteraceae bacterium]|nr:M28 family peptidase [Ktedonobacteraceae bacterium]